MYQCNVFYSAFNKLQDERNCRNQSKGNFTSWRCRFAALATLEARSFCAGVWAKNVGIMLSFNFRFVPPNNLFRRSTLSSKLLGSKWSEHKYANFDEFSLGRPMSVSHFFLNNLFWSFPGTRSNVTLPSPLPAFSICFFDSLLQPNAQQCGISNLHATSRLDFVIY